MLDECRRTGGRRSDGAAVFLMEPLLTSIPCFSRMLDRVKHAVIVCV